MSIFDNKKAFNFYRSYYETSLLLPKEDRAEFLEAIVNYQFTGQLVEPKRQMALLAFRGQLHSLKKQVIGYSAGLATYPNGNPTKGRYKGSDKGSHKQVQGQEQEKEKEQVQDKEKRTRVNQVPEFSEFLEYCKTVKQYIPELDAHIENKYNSWVAADWHDGKGNKIKHWKGKATTIMPFIRDMYEKNFKPTETKEQQEHYKPRFG